MMKEVKAVTKKYKTKSGIKKSTSKRVDLGVTDIFETGECVAIIPKSDFDNLDKIIADNNDNIDNLNENVAKYKAELESKINIIGDLSKEIKALKNKIAELESNISSKDEKLIDSENIIATLNDNVDELTATVGELKPLLLSKDSTIADLEKQIAVYDAIDISDLKYKASELDKSKNIIIRLQNEKLEYVQLVNFHKEIATAFKNQRWYNKILGKNATADITTPPLKLIDLSGNSVDSDADDGTAINNDSGKTITPNDE